MNEEIDLHIHRKLSLLAGICYPMPENYESRSKCFKFFWTLYVVIAYGLMVVELVSQAVQITISIRNVEILTTCTLSTLYIVQFLLKMFVFRKNRQKFQNIFNEMLAISSSLMKNPFGDTHYTELYNKYYKKVMSIGIYKGSIQLASNICLNILFCVLSWVGMKREITAAFSWTPYDSSKNPGYTLTCIFEMLCYGSVTARTAVVDLLFWVMVVVPAVQLKYMRYLMEIMNKDYDKEEIEISGAIFPDDSVSEDVLDSRLEWWMKHHQRILSMVQNFGEFASAFLAVNYVASLIDLFMSGFVAISSSQWDIFQRILINAIIITDAFQLYVVSLAGDWLRESSQNVADDGFTTVIFKAKKKFRKHYLFILSRTRRLVQIRFGGINPLSSQTFLRLIQLTMTYFVTVIQIKNSKNEKSKQISIPLSQ